MNALAKAVRHGHDRTSEVWCAERTEGREIRYMSHARARRAGKWAIKKYSKVFKKLAGA